MLAGRRRGQVAAVAAALGFNGPVAAEGFGELAENHLTPALSPCGEGDVSGDVRGQYGIGAGAAGAVGDGDRKLRVEG